MTPLEQYWFPWYPSKFKAKTMHLTDLEELYYRRAIDFYMETRKPLLDNDIALARIVGANPKDFAPYGQMLRQFFKPDGNGYLVNKTCDGLLSDQGERSKIYSENGKKGGRPKKASFDLAFLSTGEKPLENNTEKPIAKLNVTTEQDITEQNKKERENTNVFSSAPRANGISPRQSLMPEEARKRDAEFEQFWTGWRPFEMDKGSKSEARKSFDKSRKEKENAAIIEKRDQYLDICHKLGQRTKHAVTWLNQRGWDQEYEPAKVQGRQHHDQKTSYMDKIAHAAEIALAAHHAEVEANRNAPWNQHEPPERGGPYRDLLEGGGPLSDGD